MAASCASIRVQLTERGVAHYYPRELAKDCLMIMMKYDIVINKKACRKVLRHLDTSLTEAEKEALIACVEAEQ